MILIKKLIFISSINIFSNSFVKMKLIYEKFHNKAYGFSYFYLSLINQMRICLTNWMIIINNSLLCLKKIMFDALSIFKIYLDQTSSLCYSNRRVGLSLNIEKPFLPSFSGFMRHDRS